MAGINSYEQTLFDEVLNAVESKLHLLGDDIVGQWLSEANGTLLAVELDASACNELSECLRYIMEEIVTPITTSDNLFAVLPEVKQIANSEANKYGLWINFDPTTHYMCIGHEGGNSYYTIEYSTVYGTAPAGKLVSTEFGKGYTLTEADLPTLTADGNVFNGWTSNGTAVSVGDTISTDTTLTAVWRKVAIITYHSEHGTVPEPATVVLDDFGELPIEGYIPELEAEGYIFKGWGMVDGEVYDFTGYFISGDIDLYAVWEEVVKTKHLDLYINDGNTWVKKDLHKTDGGAEWKKKQVKEAYKQVGGEWVQIAPQPNPLPPIGTSLGDCTWEQISAISAAGKAAEYFSVGDTKSVYLKGKVGTLNLDTTLYVYILGFDHNSEIEGKGITFGTFKTADGVDVALIDSKYNSAYSNGTKCFNMNHWGNYNYGGWAGCDMRYDILGSTDNAPSGYGASPASGRTGYDPSAACATNPVANTLMAALPADLRSVIKPMTKYTNNTGASGDTEAKVTVTTDYLPLLAEFEIFGARTYANSYEQNKQKQYDYYAAGNSKQKYRHSATSSTAVWWERSAYCYGNTDDRTNFCCVSKSSNAGKSSAYSVFGIAPIFLV